MGGWGLDRHGKISQVRNNLACFAIFEKEVII
jgi:hypothetical protein